jgi:hypothetical protein
MRRLFLMTGALAAIVSLGTAGIASAASSSGIRIKPNSTWTQTNLKNGGCEVQTFSSDGKWTADRLGDAGTYVASGATLTETWTAGQDAGQTLKAHWSKPHNEYQGNGSGGLSGGTKWKSTLVKGSTSKC